MMLKYMQNNYGINVTWHSRIMYKMTDVCGEIKFRLFKLIWRHHLVKVYQNIVNYEENLKAGKGTYVAMSDGNADKLPLQNEKLSPHC